ncbi:MAG: NADH-quinone oxidoreductase subunit NuoF [Ignavibacteriae bacterium]|nr:NADH-quinone oxidoreductase subunit NuoF [Ignavibacteriota bacterium]MCB9216977.1 NADH-quinone oxidoreductase subunit NuoF [Ignavibacteria bacterium]
MALNYDDLPKLVLPPIQDLHKLEVYRQHGGYEMYRKALTMTPDQVIDEVKKSGLRGRGGACFPTGLKWSFMPKGNDRPKYLCINGDESEPGSFKDRQVFEYNPHQMIEGILIAGYAMGIEKAFIYIRGEYHKWVSLTEKAVEDAYAAGLIGKRMKETFGGNYSMEIVVHKGAGAYICGEESSLMESLEGKRPYPRIKPPFPAQKGLWGMPTTINNVETLANVPVILRMGGEEFAKIGAASHPGTILLGISGHVNKPGVYEVPTGLALLDIINDLAGGVPNGKKIKMVIPGGSSMPPLRGDELEEIMMDADSIKAAGSYIGTAGVMVMDEDTDIPHVLRRTIHFYHHESCGQCTPCREGCGWLEKMLTRVDEGDATSEDLDLLIDVANNIDGNTICALGEAAAWPTKFTIQRLREEFEKKVKDTRAPQPKNIVHGLRADAHEIHAVNEPAH